MFYLFIIYRTQQTYNVQHKRKNNKRKNKLIIKINMVPFGKLINRKKMRNINASVIK